MVRRCWGWEHVQGIVLVDLLAVQCVDLSRCAAHKSEGYHNDLRLVCSATDHAAVSQLNWLDDPALLEHREAVDVLAFADVDIVHVHNLGRPQRVVATHVSAHHM